MTSSDWRSQIFEKKFPGTIFEPASLNQAQNEVFRHFLEFGSLFFFEIAFNDSLQQCLTSIRDKNPRKIFLSPKFVPNEPKLGPKLGFSPFSQPWFINFCCNCIQ